MAQIARFTLERTEIIVGPREIPDYQHFLLIPQCFQKPSSHMFVITKDLVVKVSEAPISHSFFSEIELEFVIRI